MAIDEFKLELFSKALSLFVLCLYISSQVYLALWARPGSGYADALEKSRLIRPSCLLLLGGSNARHAFSAAQLSTDSCPAINLAVQREVGNFDRYMEWLGRSALSDTVVYSTLFVFSSQPTEDDGALKSLKHVTPLASRLKQMLGRRADRPFIDFTSSGDQIHYVCYSVTQFPAPDARTFERATPEVVTELVRRVTLIRRVTGASKVVLHAPRVYMTDESSLNQKSKFLPVFNKRLAEIRRAGLEVLDTPALHSDKGLFCDDTHASLKGRDLFSAQVKAALSKLQ